MHKYDIHNMVEDIINHFNPPNEKNITTCLNCSKTFQFDWDVMINHLNEAHGIKASADAEKYRHQIIFDEKKEMTPKSGYNIVELDDFAPLGEQLTCIEHFETREEAEEFAQKNDSKESPLYVYGPEDI
jgi:hypothetical protein